MGRSVTPVANTKAAYAVSMRRHGDDDGITLRPPPRNSPLVQAWEGFRALCTLSFPFSKYNMNEFTTAKYMLPLIKHVKKTLCIPRTLPVVLSLSWNK